MRTMVLIRISVHVDWTGLPSVTWGEETVVSASDTLSADSGWMIRKLSISTQHEPGNKCSD